jgi:arylsulfatase A-like enzyme
MNTTTRRDFFKLTGLSALALAGFPRVGEAQLAPVQGLESRSGRRPNIVYLLADQWRASALGYTGDPNVKTPSLDALAKRSINFCHAVSVCPVCTPYRAALLTGRYPTSTGMFMNDLYLPDEALCMAEIFKAAGYDTGYIGKWHLDGHGRSAFIPPERRQGFDYWKVAECEHNYNHSHYYTGTSPEKKFWPGYDAFAQTRDAQQYLRDHAKATKPFVLVVSYGTPHFPHNSAPEEYKQLYPPESIKLPPNVPATQQAAARKEIQGYYAHCTALDKCIGDIVKTLDETGLTNDTVLVFTSDHGEMMGAQNIRPHAKQVPWDESIRVPFLLRFPALHGGEGRVVQTPINTPDILPTLLGLANVPVPAVIEGENLADLMRQPGTERDRAALIMSVASFVKEGEEYRGIRTSRYTYVQNVAGPWLLYDNQEDPYQMKNLVADPTRAALRNQLNERLQQELKRIGDDFQPRRHYTEAWGYNTRGEDGGIPYTKGAPMQSPSKKTFQQKLHERLGHKS